MTTTILERVGCCCCARRRGGGGGGMRRKNPLFVQRTWFFIFFLSLFSFVVVQWMLSYRPPFFHNPPPPPDSCSADTTSTIEDSPYLLQDHAVCSKACGQQCFPRIRGLCIAHDVVTICDGGGGGGGSEGALPSHLRFAGKDQFWRRNVAIKRGGGACAQRRRRRGRQGEGEEEGPSEGPDGAVWIQGTQMVADMKMMPNGHRVGPSPHHEAEKLIPAILLSRFYGLNRSSLFWFTDPVHSAVTSVWSMGMIAAFADHLDVKFTSVPDPGRPPICFEDAVLFSGVTNAGYVPNTAANDWLRGKVLAQCKIPELDARTPAKDVVIVNRVNSSRAIENVDEVEAVLESELGVPVKRIVSGVGDFCQQAKVIAEADVFVTPHGSHNVNFLFARPGAIVLEVFPLLYYIDWFRNYVHSARLNYHELFGTWPADEGGMPFRMTLYALLFGWKDCFSVRQCMNYAKRQHVYVNIHQLQRLLLSMNG